MAAQPLTRNQTQTSLIAGAVAHTIFQTGWFLFGMSLAGLIATALFGNIVALVTRSFGGDDPNAVLRAIGGGTDILFWVVLSFLIGSLLLIGLSILVSGWMLSASGLRRPWRATMGAVGVAALVDIALFWVYLGIANLLTESRIAGPVLLTPVIALVGGIVVGALIWWLMALSSREKTAAAIEPAAKPAAKPVSAPAKPAAKPVSAPAAQKTAD